MARCLNFKIPYKERMLSVSKERSMTIAVIGSGSGGLGLCYELKLHGHTVRLWNRTATRLLPLIENGKVLDVEDDERGNKKVTIDFISDNLSDVIASADIAIAITPSNVHEDLGDRFAQLPSFEIPMILMPGRTFGSYAFIDHYRLRKPTGHVICLETQTILHACRSFGSRVHIFGTKHKIFYTSLLPLEVKVQKLISELLPQFEFMKNYFDVALNNVGAFFHPIPAILNSGRIESKKGFKHYTEGISPRIAGYIDKIDKEKESLCQIAGIKHIPLTQWLEAEYGAQGNSLYERIQSVSAYKYIDSPTTLEHRYVQDDMITGLVPLYKTAEYFKVEMPTLKKFLDFASSFMGYDYYKNGRGFPSKYWKELIK